MTFTLIIQVLLVYQQFHLAMEERQPLLFSAPSPDPGATPSPDPGATLSPPLDDSLPLPPPVPLCCRPLVQGVHYLVILLIFLLMLAWVLHEFTETACSTEVAPTSSPAPVPTPILLQPTSSLLQAYS